MGRFIKSISGTRELSNSLKGLKKDLGEHKEVIAKNTQELSIINKNIQEKKVSEGQLELKESLVEQSDVQWVKSDPPALKIDTHNILKKLDIL